MPDYTVMIALQNDGTSVATFPDIPDALAVGRSFEEALGEAAKSLEAAIRNRFLAGQSIPVPRAEGSLRLHQDVLSAVLA